MKKLEIALDKVLETTYNALKQRNIEWVIMGSVATSLQGIDVNPADIDILMKNPKGDIYYKKRMNINNPESQKFWKSIGWKVIPQIKHLYKEF